MLEKKKLTEVLTLVNIHFASLFAGKS